MIDKSSLLKSQGSLYLEFISKDGLFHKMLLLSLMGFLTGWCNPELSSYQGSDLVIFAHERGIPSHQLALIKSLPLYTSPLANADHKDCCNYNNFIRISESVRPSILKSRLQLYLFLKT